RVLIAERDAAFKRGDQEFTNEFAAADGNLARALGEAIMRVKTVRVTAGHARLISSICVEAEVLGHRADVVIDHAARALAAYRRTAPPPRRRAPGPLPSATPRPPERTSMTPPRLRSRTGPASRSAATRTSRPRQSM